MTDPLAAFRKNPLPSAASSGTAGGKEEYAAFGAKDRVFRLRVRRANAPVHAPTYSALQNIIYDGKHGKNFILVFTLFSVLVRGRNLQPVVAALENSMADFIQQYDPDFWDKPADASAPFIETIEIRDLEPPQGGGTDRREKPPAV